MFNYSLNMGSLMGIDSFLCGCLKWSFEELQFFFFVSCFSALVLSYLSICLDYNKNNS